MTPTIDFISLAELNIVLPYVIVYEKIRKFTSGRYEDNVTNESNTEIIEDKLPNGYEEAEPLWS